MSELAWLNKYSGESTKELLALQGQYRTDSIVVAFEQALDQKSFRLGGESLLTAEERVVLAVEALEREVNNGGYGHFLSNTSAELVKDFVAALHQIGRPDVADVTQTALDAGNAEDLPDEVTLSRCDDEYFRIAGDLADPLLEFIKKAQDRIFVP